MKCDRCGEEHGKCLIEIKVGYKKVNVCYDCHSYIERKLEETLNRVMQTKEKRLWL